jgi:hypothetical protein
MEDDKQTPAGCNLSIDMDTLDKINKKEYISTNKSVIINEFTPSGWTCYLFGGDQINGLTWKPAKGKVPNVFVRWMMKLCFACTWVKKS